MDIKGMHWEKYVFCDGKVMKLLPAAKYTLSFCIFFESYGTISKGFDKEVILLTDLLSNFCIKQINIWDEARFVLKINISLCEDCMILENMGLVEMLISNYFVHFMQTVHKVGYNTVFLLYLHHL